MAVLLGAGAGYWIDLRWGTTPYGVIVGVVIGFAAMVLRLLRMGRNLPPGPSGAGGADVSGQPSGSLPVGRSAPGAAGDDADAGEDRGPAETPGLSDIWRDDATDERD